MSTWLKCTIGLSMKTSSSLHLTKTAIKLILYFQTALAGGGEEKKKPRTLVENKEKLARGQVFVLSYLR